jgi:hypothetical protein
MATRHEQPAMTDIRIRSPANIIIAGPTGSGKTQLLMDLIKRSTSVATRTPVEIVYCYGAWQKAFEDVTGVRFVKGLLDVTKDLPDDERNRWLIIDDLMTEATEGGRSDALFTKHGHHLNLTVFLVVQNLFLKSLRTMSLNAHYFFLGKNPRDASTIVNLARQMTPGDTKFLAEVYKDATREPYSFLFVSARQETDDSARFIKNYGRGGSMHVYNRV